MIDHDQRQHGTHELVEDSERAKLINNKLMELMQSYQPNQNNNSQLLLACRSRDSQDVDAQIAALEQSAQDPSGNDSVVKSLQSLRKSLGFQDVAKFNKRIVRL